MTNTYTPTVYGWRIHSYHQDTGLTLLHTDGTVKRVVPEALLFTLCSTGEISAAEAALPKPKYNDSWLGPDPDSDAAVDFDYGGEWQ